VNQQVNQNLEKILSMIPEFQHDEIELEYVLKDVIEHKVKAYTKYGFHSSRRSCVTFLVQAGTPTDIIIRITGWVDYRMLESYLKVFGDSLNDDTRYLNF
jgi:hypothetical protein